MEMISNRSYLGFKSRHKFAADKYCVLFTGLQINVPPNYVHSNATVKVADVSSKILYNYLGILSLIYNAFSHFDLWLV